MIRLPITPHRVAILKPSALGDIVHALPILSALRELYPQAEISWVVNQSFAALLHGHPHLDRVIPFDRGAYRRGIRQALTYTWQFGQSLQQYRFDMVLDLQGLLRTGFMTAATLAPVRIGFANAREGSRHFYTHRIAVPNAEMIHAVDRYWTIIEQLTMNPPRKQFVVPLDSAILETWRTKLAAFPRPWLAFALGANWTTKRWPIAHFADLANRTQREFGGTCFLLGSRDDTVLSSEIAPLISGFTVDLTGQTTLPELSAFLYLADVMIANDTGPLHLAAALGKPCLAPYTCTKIVKHGPYGLGNIGIETSVACAGSYLKKCPNGLICFEELTPDRLWPKLKELLQTWQNQYAP